MGHIYVDSNGAGPVNRFNCIFNAIVAHYYTKRKIIVHWNDRDVSCQCALTDIYSEGDSSVLHIQEDVVFPTENFYMITEWVNDPKCTTERPITSKNYTDFTAESFKSFCSSLPDSIDLIIRSPNVYPFDLSTAFLIDEFHRLLVLRDDFKKLIKNFLVAHNYELALHMRLTEKIIVNGYDINALTCDVENIKNTYPSQKILVCSDDPEIENKVVQMIPNSCHYEKIAHLEKLFEGKPYLWWDSNQPFGYVANLIRNKQYSFDGFVDLYLLGCSKKIVGINTGYSTYNILANWFSNHNIRDKYFT